MRIWGSRIIVLSCCIMAGYLLFDGLRFLFGNGYFAPGGQLGPWVDVLALLRIDAETTTVAAALVAYGIALLGALWCFLWGLKGARRALIALAVLGLLYVPFGTVCSLVTICFVCFTPAQAQEKT